eukprot:gene20795-24925_t
MACVGVLPAYAVVIFATRRTEMQDREVAPDESVAYVAAIPLDLTQPLQLRLAVRAFLNPFNEKDATRHYLDGEQFIYGAGSVYSVACDASERIPIFRWCPRCLARTTILANRDSNCCVFCAGRSTFTDASKGNFLSGDAFSAASSASKYNNIIRAGAGDALGVVIDGVFVSGGLFSGYALRTVVTAAAAAADG